MKNIGLIIFSFIILIACQEKKQTQDGFVLNGTIKGAEDSTIIEFYIDNIIIDSTYIINEKFQFSGKVEKPTPTIIAIKNTRNWKTIWIENHEMTFEADLENYKTGKVIGSKTQKDNELLFSRVWPLALYQDSLLTLIFSDTLSQYISDSLSLERNKISDQENIIYQEFIREFPNSPVSICWLNGSKIGWDKELVEGLFQLMDSKSKNSEEGKLIARYLKINKPVDIWDKYIDFTQFDTNGKKVKLSDIKGKYILVDFWASWCGFCRKENPNLVEQYNLYKDKGFEVLGVSFDNDKTKWLDAIEKDGLPWLNVSDLKGNENEAKLLYGISGIPQNILIDKSGVIVAKNLRGEGLVNELRIRFED